MSDWTTAVVDERHEETGDIVAFTLSPPAGACLPPFAAGAHIEVRLGELIRHYSLLNGPGERDRYLLGVLRDKAGRGGSMAMCDGIGVGDTISIRGPHNNFPLADGDGPVLLLAGGIGITPILAMAEQLSAEGRTFALHYCARAPEAMAFRRRIEDSAFADRAVFHFDTLCEGGRPDLAAILADPDPRSHVYICGPEPMIAAASTVAKEGGWASGHIHVEHFAAALPQDHASDTPFRVKIKSSGQTVEVPADKSVVQALRAAGIRIETSCSEGYCGFCITDVLEGVPDHRDTVLTDEEHEANTLFTPCCSRAKTDLLVLDL